MQLIGCMSDYMQLHGCMSTASWGGHAFGADRATQICRTWLR